MTAAARAELGGVKVSQIPDKPSQATTILPALEAIRNVQTNAGGDELGNRLKILQLSQAEQKNLLIVKGERESYIFKADPRRVESERFFTGVEMYPDGSATPTKLTNVPVTLSVRGEQYSPRVNRPEDEDCVKKIRSVCLNEFKTCEDDRNIKCTVEREGKRVVEMKVEIGTSSRPAIE